MGSEIKLKIDLVREIKRGHPWVYRRALHDPLPDQSGIYQLLDRKGKFLAWCLFDAKSDLAARILSFKKVQPTEEDLLFALKRRIEIKQSLVQYTETTGYRLLNGEGDGFPGLICDIYGDIGVLQTDGKTLNRVWDLPWWSQTLVGELDLKTIIFKPQKGKGEAQRLFGEPLTEPWVSFKENSVWWTSDVLHGQKTGFFLDQRDNRELIKKLSHGKSVANICSYTGGFSVSAGIGGATFVESVDLSPHAIERSQFHWELNGLEKARHSGVVADAFEYFQGAQKIFDLIVVDPPSFAPNKSSKKNAIESYVNLFTLSGRQVKKRNGLLAWASCSSHITGEDFFEIARTALSKATLRGRILYVGGQGKDHVFPIACRELQYLKFLLIETF